MSKAKQATRNFGVAPGQVWKHGKPFKLYRVLEIEQRECRYAIVQRQIGGALALDEDKLRLPCRKLRDIAERVS